MTTLSEEEFDSILQRNKSVSSGAILRAVQDASEGVQDPVFVLIYHCINNSYHSVYGAVITVVTGTCKVKYLQNIRKTF